MLAYRTIDTTIEVSSHGVGPPVQIAVCDDNGTHVLTDEEISQIGTAVDRWKVLEADTLNSLKDGAADSEGDADELPALDADG